MNNPSFDMSIEDNWEKVIVPAILQKQPNMAPDTVAAFRRAYYMGVIYTAAKVSVAFAESTMKAVDTLQEIGTELKEYGVEAAQEIER